MQALVEFVVPSPEQLVKFEIELKMRIMLMLVKPPDLTFVASVTFDKASAFVAASSSTFAFALEPFLQKIGSFILK